VGRHCFYCGEDNSERARFCQSCAAPVASLENPKVRRNATVLFADIVESTSMAERLDPESVSELMFRFYNDMKAALERHGGRLERFIGDAVMGTFGLPFSEGDDALCAVRAAFEMKRVARRIDEESRRKWDAPLEIRIGINTGEVVAGGGSSVASFIAGDAVNVAARFQQTAQPGQVVVGEATHRLLRGLAIGSELEPLALKGKSLDVRAFCIERVLDKESSVRYGALSPLVGRDRELWHVVDAFDDVSSQSVCRLMTVVGVPGVGKSRLVGEVVKYLEHKALILQGTCLPYGTGITFWPIRTIVNRAAAIAEDETPEDALGKLTSLLGDEDDAAPVVERVAQVTGLAPVTDRPEEIFASVRRFLESLASKRPLLVVIDDIHWGEPTLLELLEHVVAGATRCPILLLCVGRPELLDKHPEWTALPRASVIHLEPLIDDDADRLMENFLGADALPQPIRKRINEVAEGNPFFLEEVLSSLVEDDVLVNREGEWMLDRDPADVKIPITIHALLTERLDRLAPEEQKLLAAAAVIGVEFDRESLSALRPADRPDDIQARIETLVARQLLGENRSGALGDDFRFRHVLIRDAVYHNTSKKTRARLHETHARWLEDRAGVRVTEFEEILGYHFECAARYRAELGEIDDTGRALSDKAAGYLASAGRRALDRADASAATNLLSRALSLSDEHDAHYAKLATALGSARLETGDFEAADDVLTRAIECSGENAVGLEARLLRLWIPAFTKPEGQAEQAGREIRETIPALERLGDDRVLALAWRMLALIEGYRCKFDAAVRGLEEAVIQAEAAGDRRELSESLSWLPLSIMLSPEPVDAATPRCEALLERYAGDRKVESSAQVALAGLRAMGGDITGARELLDRARETLGDLGLKVWSAIHLSQTAGFVEFCAQDFAAAERELRAGYDVLVQIGENIFRSTTAALLGMALYELGRHDDAEQLAIEARGAAASDDLFSQIMWRLVLARVATARGQVANAEMLAREAVGMCVGIEFPNLEGDSWAVLAEARFFGGNLEGAIEAASRAIERYEAKGNVAGAAPIKAIMATVAG
jgi:predicted ATPase/class 3 adenylate cyclase